MNMATLAWRSAWSRRFALSLTLGAIMLSVTLLLAVERLRHSAHDSFAAALTGTDLIVGPRSHPIQLLLGAVFHLGEAQTGMRWDSVERLASHPAVAWTVPIALGDSHRGFPVVATSAAYFIHYRHGHDQALSLARGRYFGAAPGGTAGSAAAPDLFEVVLGAEVARRLAYHPGQRLTLSHGVGDHHGPGQHEHGDKPFTVVGVLAPTGTPVDRSLHIRLEAMEALHLDWQGGAPLPGQHLAADQLHKFDLRPQQVNAVLVGLHQRAAVLRLQRQIDSDTGEALSAVMPAVALDELWQLTAGAERLLTAIAVLVALVALAGLAATVLAGLQARQRELAVLRAIGARPRHVFLLLVYEGLGITLAGALAAMLLVQGAGVALAPWLLARWGIVLKTSTPGGHEAMLVAAVLAAGLLASLVPGWRAYRMALADGLAPKA